VLIDSRHGVKDVDREMLKMLDESAVGYRLVLTKADKIKAAAHPEIIATSSEKGMGLAELRAAVVEALE
jgi:GTP-binding protein